MKLNITNEKLTRLLLSANPVLANCKGSAKAVRLFMNMLGMKCIVVMPHSKVLVNENCTDTIMPTVINFTTNSTKLLDVDWFHAGNYYNSGKWPDQSDWPSDHGTWWPTDASTPITNGNGCIYESTAYIVNTLVQGAGEFPGKKFLNNSEPKPASIKINLVGPNAAYIEIIFEFKWSYAQASNDVYNYTIKLAFQSIQAHNDHITGYTTAQAIKDYNDLFKDNVDAAFTTMLTRLDNVQNLKITSKTLEPLVLGIPYSNTTDYVQMYVTNVADKDLLPVKSIIAKQLQEIVPINMIVLAENIIGY